MKVYEVECGGVITVTAQDMEKAALNGAAVIKDNLHLIYVRAVHERNFEPALEDPSAKNSQKDSMVATRNDAPQPVHVVPARMTVLRSGMFSVVPRPNCKI